MYRQMVLYCTVQYCTVLYFTVLYRKFDDDDDDEDPEGWGDAAGVAWMMSHHGGMLSMWSG